MSAGRVLAWVIGLALVVIAAFMLFFETGLDAYVPLTIAGAGLLLIIGVAVMGASEKMRSEHHEGPTEEHHGHH